MSDVELRNQIAAILHPLIAGDRAVATETADIIMELVAKHGQDAIRELLSRPT